MQIIYGFRALSVLLIIIDHFFMIKGTGTADSFPFSFFRDGMSGIYLIFIVESYVIAKKIIELKETQKKISIFKFTIKRIITTIPVLWVFILTIKFLSPLGESISQESFISAMTLTFNYLGKPHANAIMHFWAFCAEETMIVLGIPLLILLKRKPAILLFFTLAIVFNLLRIESLFSQDNIHHFNWWKYMETHLLGFGFCYGFLLALIGNNFWIKLFNLKVHWLAFFIILIAGPYGEANLGTPYHWLGKPLISSLFLAIIFKYCVLHKDFFFSKIISTKPVQWFGIVSFSMYLWQQPFTFVLFPKEGGIPEILQTIGLLLISGTVAYFIVEKPLKKLALRIKP